MIHPGRIHCLSSGAGSQRVRTPPGAGGWNTAPMCKLSGTPTMGPASFDYESVPDRLAHAKQHYAPVIRPRADNQTLYASDFVLVPAVVLLVWLSLISPPRTVPVLSHPHRPGGKFQRGKFRKTLEGHRRDSWLARRSGVDRLDAPDSLAWLRDTLEKMSVWPHGRNDELPPPGDSAKTT